MSFGNDHNILRVPLVTRRTVYSLSFSLTPRHDPCDYTKCPVLRIRVMQPEKTSRTLIGEFDRMRENSTSR